MRNDMTKTISLAYRDGGSDKVYNASLAEQAGGYVVNFAYGRRGNALTVGSKTTAPVAIEAANKIFDKLIKEKMAKGYSIESGTIPSIAALSTNEKIDTGMHAQLLNAIEEDHALRLLEDDDHLAQEKYDGRRIRIKKIGTELIAANRKGQQIPVPEFLSYLSRTENDFEIDGENMGSFIAVFDVLQFNAKNVRLLSAQHRIGFIDLVTEGSSALRKVTTAFGSEDKQMLYIGLLKGKKEGIVFKRKDAPYVPGRPASKGPQLKFKFYATASFIVMKVNTQRSILLGLCKPGIDSAGKSLIVEAGNCTIPVNYDVPNERDIVEVKYLYAFKESGSVYQPSYLGKRDDIEVHDCTTFQLKFKPEEKE